MHDKWEDNVRRLLRMQTVSLTYPSDVRGDPSEHPI